MKKIFLAILLAGSLAACNGTTSTTTEKKADSVINKIEDKADSLKDKVQANADSLKNKIERKADSAKVKVEEKMEKMDSAHKAK